jgi:hypothetical protein
VTHTLDLCELLAEAKETVELREYNTALQNQMAASTFLPACHMCDAWLMAWEIKN